MNRPEGVRVAHAPHTEPDVEEPAVKAFLDFTTRQCFVALVVVAGVATVGCAVMVLLQRWGLA